MRLPAPSSSLTRGHRPCRSSSQPKLRAAPLFGLAPGRVCHATSVTGSAVGSYPTVSPLPTVREATRRRFAFCCTFRHPHRGAPAPNFEECLAVSQYHALWSPDFPPVRKHCEERGPLAKPTFSSRLRGPAIARPADTSFQRSFHRPCVSSLSKGGPQPFAEFREIVRIFCVRRFCSTTERP